MIGRLKRILFPVLIAAAVSALQARAAHASCASPANAIEAENCLPGTPTAQWDLAVPNAGEPTLQGFATEISVNVGEIVRFKIKSTAAPYTVDIYRVGYYGGTGARKVASVTPVPYPQVQPACYSDATGILDCGNWAQSATWNVPANAVSGTYLARLTRTDTGGASHIIFIVRNDASHSDILFQNSDSTWQAYNAYGGFSLYKGPNAAGRAFKLSYNRPFTTRLDGSSYFFTHEYPTIRWIEANGYDVSYFTNTDTDRRGSLITNHKVFFSVGHDEYWSAGMRTSMENAQNAGVHMAFMSANEGYWKIRYEPSFDGTNTAYRTLVCYKESYEDTPLDPMDPPIWTGTWEDPRFKSTTDGGRPQNAVTGQLYRVNTYRQDAIGISSEDGKLRFWRNTPAASLAAGARLSFPETLGYEWDEDFDNGYRPAGSIRLSSATYFIPVDDINAGYKITDWGSNYVPHTATHNMTLFKKPSGAIIFGAGTMQWTWGLEVGHDHGSHYAAVPTIRQATVNVLADMGVQPRTLQSGLVAATASTDTTPPTATITFPLDGSPVPLNSSMTVTGTAVDAGGGRVGGIEVSVDNGTTWHPATGGRDSWTYTWFPTFSGSTVLKARATDDSLNTGPVSSPVTVGTNNAVPTITALSPSSIVPGGPAFTLTVTGTGFGSSSMVRWNGSNRTTTLVNASTLQAAIPASDIATEGSAIVTVFNPAPGGGVASGQTFIIGISCPCSIWDSSVVPANATNDANSLEVGVKFRTDVAGTITGIRFYKNTFNIRPHTGHLWSRTGTLLASVNFSSETASGWQQANFSTPVAVSSNTTYVASYFTTSGYAVNRNYFTSSGAEKSPLRALQSGVDGINAVFKYGAAPALPTDGWQDSNYWVDVVFMPLSNPIPIVNSISPASAAMGGSTFTMTVNGGNFVSSSTVRWNGSARPTVYVDSATLTATIFKADLVSSGTASVAVFNPTPGGGVSAAQNFTIFVPPPVPILNTISPSSATAGTPGFTMTVRGANFVPTSIFQWNGGDRPTTFVNSTVLTVTIPASDIVSSGTFPVAVLTSSGSPTAELFFTVFPANPVPSIANITPSSTTVNGSNFTLKVNGENFVSSSTVLWNGLNRATVFVSSTQLNAVIPASDIATVKTASITVTSPAPGGGLSNLKLFAVNATAPVNPVPTLTGIVPSSATVGGSSFTLRVNGSNFISSSTVQWNGLNRTTVFISSAQLNAIIPASDIAFVQIATVTVTNPAPGGGVSNLQSFSVNPPPIVPNPVPTSINVLPSSATAGGFSFTLTVNGSNFISSSTVRWNGLNRETQFINSTQLNAIILESDIASVGIATVTVSNPAPGGGVSNTQTFTIAPFSNPVPALSSVSPSSATAGSPAFTLALTGDNFLSSSTVRWNGAVRATVFVSSSQLSATILASDLVAAGTATITVSNPAPGGGLSNPQTFTINAAPADPNPVPSLTGIVPEAATAGGSSFTLTVNGGGFIGSSTVRWNGLSRATLYISSAQLSAVILASDVVAAGTATITVSNPAPGGGTSNGQSFTINAASTTPNPIPGVSFVSPSSTTAGGLGFTLTVSGGNFLSSSTVQWNGSARATTYLSSTQLSAAIPAADIASVGVASVTVTNPAPGGGVSNGLTVAIGSTTAGGNPIPVISSSTPTGALVGRSTLTIVVNGTGFIPASIVQRNGSNRATTYINNTTLQAVLPTADFAVSATSTLTVVNPAPGGGTSNGVPFIVGPANPVPVLSSINPTTFKVGDPGFTLSVIGTGFVPTSIVTWNGFDRPTTFINSTSLTAAIPASDLTTRAFIFVRVTNPAPGGGTSGTKTFTIRLQPTITSLSPTAVNPGGPAFTLTVNGVNIATDTVVRWNGLDRSTVYVSSIQATALILSSDTAAIGTFPITLSNLAPGGVSSAVNFSVTASTVNPIPVLNLISPSSAPAASPAFTMAVFGTNFANGAIVKWNNANRTTVFINPTRLNASITAADLAVPGVSSVTVTNPAPGGGVSSTRLFTVLSSSSTPPVLNPVPAITDISPSTTTVGGPQFTLAVNGANFISSSTVLWNGAPRTTLYISSTQLSATVFASDIVAAGTSTVTVTNPAPGGGVSNAQTFTTSNTPPVLNPVPSLTSVTPSSATAGDPSFTLIVNGGNFISSSTVQWNGVNRTTLYISSSQLNVFIPSADIAGVGIATVTATNPAPGGGVSNPLTFTINASPPVPNPAPVLDSVSPSSATAGSAAFTLTLTGSSFISDSTVRWNGADRTTVYVSSTQLNAAILASDLVTAGTATVIVTNPAPGGGVSSAQTFSIVAAPPASNPVPAITDLSPSTTTAGGSQFILTVNGVNFISSSTVQWNGAGRATLFISSTQLSATVLASDIVSAGTATVTVTSPAPGGGVSNAQTFTVSDTPPVLNPVPGLTSVSPSSATAGDAGFTLIVNGNNFISSSTVRWNGSDRTTAYINDTQLNASILSGDIASVGVATITVSNPAPGGGVSNGFLLAIGSSSAAGNPLPVISSATPSAAAVGRASLTITLNGSGFIPSAAVQWNGSNRPTVFINSTTLQTTLPASDFVASGTFPVTVLNPAPGGGTSNAVSFVVSPPNPVPSLASISPTTFKIGDPGFTLSLVGTGFTATSVVTWNGFPRPTTFINSTSLTAAIPASDLSTRSFVPVKVTNPAPGGGTSVSKTFTVRLQATLTSLSPNTANPGGPSFTLTVNGVYMATDTVVRWNGVDRVTTFVSTTQVRATIPAGDIAAAGSAQVTVFNLAPGGLSNSLKFTIAVSTGGGGPGGALSFIRNPDNSSLSAGVYTDGAQSRVYPNPWRVDKYGTKDITFDQMPQGSTVKIFTVSGHWVKTLEAPSGIATWNLRNDNGEAVASGYYIYLITYTNGKHRGTLAVIR